MERMPELVDHEELEEGGHIERPIGLAVDRLGLLA